MKRKAKAFTLVELLISITILGMLIALLSTTLHNSTQFFESTDARFEDSRKIRIISYQMQQDFQSSIYLANPTKLNVNQGNSGLVGVNGAHQGQAADQIQMHIHNHSNIVLDPNFDAEIQKVSYIVFQNDDDDYLTLVRRESFLFTEEDFSLITTNYYDDTNNNFKKSFDAVLTKRIQSFNVQYYGAINGNKDWYEEWNSNAQESSSRMPEIVKIEIEMLSEDNVKTKQSFHFLVRPTMGEDILWKI